MKHSMDGRSMLSIIPITTVWSYGFVETATFVLANRQRDDFVTYSERYTKSHNEPVWFYSWGDSTWLRCPVFEFQRANVRSHHGFGWAWHVIRKQGNKAWKNP